eukprot:m.41212 g.41212  ORF g.41212 m.41212 type:complete len:135 (-) comp10525_c0_seq1:557-961(-)
MALQTQVAIVACAFCALALLAQAAIDPVKLAQQDLKMHGLDPAQMDIFFSMHDFDNNGELDEEEVEAAYRTTLLSMTDKEDGDMSYILNSIWEHVDTDGNRRISRKEFQASVENPPDLGMFGNTIKLQDQEPVV